ncbi:MAG: GIY-YIG nuclease family protein [Gemmatimonadales bacterium]|jgi:hypothetical protein
MDRKALIREYKERRAPMGVYRVRNTVTGHALVAASLDLPSILNRHRAQLGMGGHRSRALQEDWNEHGADSFVFEVLDTLTPPDEPDYDPLPDLTVLEDLWLEKLSLSADRMHTIAPGRLPHPPRPAGPGVPG